MRSPLAVPVDRRQPVAGRFTHRLDFEIAAFGDRLQQHQVRWTLADLAPSTVLHRRTALLHMWNVLDGKAANNPVRESYKPRDREPQDRAQSYARIREVLAALPDIGRGLKDQPRERGSKTAARLSVMAYTGLPQATIKRLTPEAVDWDAGTLRVPARRKGKGTEKRLLPLTADGPEALERFAALDAWGSF